MINATADETFSVISKRLFSLFDDSALAYCGQDAGKLAAIEREAFDIICQPDGACHPHICDLNISQYKILNELCFCVVDNCVSLRSRIEAMRLY